MGRLLEVEGLTVSFAAPEGRLRAVEGLSLRLEAGETLALVGESGSGKSVTARSLMGLYAGSRVSQEGSIRFKGRELAGLPEPERAALRGAAMAMIFQEPMASFDPLASIGEQMAEARLAHAGAAGRARGRAAREAALALAEESLRAVGVPDPALRLRDYPHRLSGGTLQRVLIALALQNGPELLIADEPTTALDVTIQAQVLGLLRELGESRGMGLLFITHDLGVVAEIADRVHVMYAGRIVERASVAELFASPLHPYSRGLLESRIRRERRGGLLPSIAGSVPSPLEPPPGCRFAPRCPEAGPRCPREEPPLAPPSGGPEGREAACWLHQGGVV